MRLRIHHCIRSDQNLPETFNQKYLQSSEITKNCSKKNQLKKFEAQQF